MTIIYHVVELLATFLETYILFSLVEIYGKKSNILIKIIMSFLMTGVITYLNGFGIFSNVTQVVGIIVDAVFITITYKLKAVVSFTIVLFYFQIIYIFDFSALEVLELICGDSIIKSITIIGFTRFIFILSMKLILVTSFVAFKKTIYNKLHIDNKYFKYLLVIGIFNFLCTWFTTDSIYSDVLWRIKVSIIIDWAFMFLFVITLMLISYWMTQTEQERHQNKIIAIKSQLLESNYETMHRLYAANAQNYHDFSNHLLVIRELINNQKAHAATEYIDSISKPMQSIIQKSWTGIDVVDAIINDKYQRCMDQNISINVSAEFPSDAHIDAQDICAILANLFDNSIEACQNIQGTDKTSINLKIRPVNNMLIVKIENSVKENPLLKNKELLTTKDNSSIHGWGMQSVRSAVDKYNGFIEHLYKNNLFITIITIPL